MLVPIAFPLYWALVASLTPEAALFSEPSLWPRNPLLDHYRALFATRDFWTPIRNSLVVAGATTLFCVTVGALAAYALARLEFRGKALILGFILAVSMFPQISIVSPLYLLLREMRLINTYPGLIMPYMTFAMPLTVWLLVGYFRQLPKDLEEAALVDGASRLKAFTTIMHPARDARPRDDGDPGIHLLLERVPVRAVVHVRPGAADGAGGDRVVPRRVPGALGRDPRRLGSGDGARGGDGACSSSGESCRG